MKINPVNYLTIKEIMADVLVALNDEDTRLMTPGFYRAQVKRALDELNFDTYFNDITEDIVLPDDLIMEMPEGAYNLKLMKIYTGTPENIGYQENVYYKPTFYTEGKGMGYTARVHHRNSSDPFIRIMWRQDARYVFNIQNGLIMLSEPCQVFDYVRLTYSGIPSKTIEDIQMIPPEVSDAVILWVIERCASYLKLRDANYRVLQTDAAVQLDKYGIRGAWHQAKMRLKTLDKKMKDDILLYNSHLNF